MQRSDIFTALSVSPDKFPIRFEVLVPTTENLMQVMGHTKVKYPITAPTSPSKKSWTVSPAGKATALTDAATSSSTTVSFGGLQFADVRDKYASVKEFIIDKLYSASHHGDDKELFYQKLVNNYSSQLCSLIAKCIHRTLMTCDDQNYDYKLRPKLTQSLDMYRDDEGEIRFRVIQHDFQAHATPKAGTTVKQKYIAIPGIIVGEFVLTDAGFKLDFLACSNTLIRDLCLEKEITRLHDRIAAEIQIEKVAPIDFTELAQETDRKNMEIAATAKRKLKEKKEKEQKEQAEKAPKDKEAEAKKMEEETQTKLAAEMKAQDEKERQKAEEAEKKAKLAAEQAAKEMKEPKTLKQELIDARKDEELKTGKAGEKKELRPVDPNPPATSGAAASSTATSPKAPALSSADAPSSPQLFAADDAKRAAESTTAAASGNPAEPLVDKAEEPKQPGFKQNHPILFALIIGLAAIVGVTIIIAGLCFVPVVGPVLSGAVGSVFGKIAAALGITAAIKTAALTFATLLGAQLGVTIAAEATLGVIATAIFGGVLTALYGLAIAAIGGIGALVARNKLASVEGIEPQPAPAATTATNPLNTTQLFKQPGLEPNSAPADQKDKDDASLESSASTSTASKSEERAKLESGIESQFPGAPKPADAAPAPQPVNAAPAQPQPPVDPAASVGLGLTK